MSAIQAISDLNDVSDGKEDDVRGHITNMEKPFKEIEFPINNNQLATAGVLVELLNDHPRILC